MDVDGITVAKAMEIQGASVVSGSIAAGTGHLILETGGGTEIDAGLVVPSTDDMIVGAHLDVDDRLILDRQDGGVVDSGVVQNTLSLLDVYPVGAVYMSVVDTDPGTLFGGTWAAWGSGRVPVGVDAGQTEFDTVEETGGAKTVTLTAAQSGSPAHTHVGLKVGVTDIEWVADAGGTAGSTIRASAGQPISVNANVAANAAEAHTNLQPYITCYMWKRTA